MLPFEDRAPVERRRFPFVMLLLVVANTVVVTYMLGLAPGQIETFARTYGLVPSVLLSGSAEAPFYAYSALITSLFVHAGSLHFFGNMVFRWIFGDNVESALGHLTFLLLYLASGILASVAHILFFPASTLPTVSASGAIAGGLGAYLLLFPTAQVRVLLFFGPFFSVGRVAALLLIAGWFILQLFQGVTGLDPDLAEAGGVAYLAHVGGFLAGAALTALIRAVRGQSLGSLKGAIWVNWTFRNWLLLVVVIVALFGYSAVVGGEGGAQVQGYTILAVAGVALIDGFLRAVGQRALLGPGRGIGRMLAVIQVIAAAVALTAVLL